MSTSAYVTEVRFEIAEETYGQLLTKIHADQKKIKDKSRIVSSEAARIDLILKLFNTVASSTTEPVVSDHVNAEHLLSILKIP